MAEPRRTSHSIDAFAVEFLHSLGINTERVTSFMLVCETQKLPVLTVTHVLSPEMGEPLRKMVEGYEVAPRLMGRVPHPGS